MIVKKENEFKTLKNKATDNSRLHFLHIGKTGGSAIKFSLKNHSKTKYFKLKFHGHNIKLPDIPIGEKIFFCVREPIERYVSGFYSRQRQGRPKYNFPYSKKEKLAFRIFNCPNELALALSSNDAKLKSNAEFAMKSIGHIKSSYWDWFIDESYLRKRISDILFVCRQNHLQNDFKKLKEILGVPSFVELPDRNSIDAHANPKKMNTKLDGQARINLKNWYSEDYNFLEVLNDCFTKDKMP